MGPPLIYWKRRCFTKKVCCTLIGYDRELLLFLILSFFIFLLIFFNLFLDLIIKLTIYQKEIRLPLILPVEFRSEHIQETPRCFSRKNFILTQFIFQLLSEIFGNLVYIMFLNKDNTKNLPETSIPPFTTNKPTHEFIGLIKF